MGVTRAVVHSTRQGGAAAVSLPWLSHRGGLLFPFPGSGERGWGTDLGQLDARVPVQHDEPRVHRAQRRVQLLQCLQEERHPVRAHLVRLPEFGIHAEDRVEGLGGLLPIVAESAELTVRPSMYLI